MRLLSIIAVIFAASDAFADWPQWRGADGSGIADTPLPADWNAHSTNLKWQADLPGTGVSSPIVSNGRVFVTTAYQASDGDQVFLAARLTILFLAVAGVLLFPLCTFTNRIQVSAERQTSSTLIALVIGWSVVTCATVLTLLKAESSMYTWAFASRTIPPGAALPTLLILALVISTYHAGSRKAVITNLTAAGVALLLYIIVPPSRYSFVAIVFCLFAGLLFGTALRRGHFSSLQTMANFATRTMVTLFTLAFLGSIVFCALWPDMFWTSGEVGPTWMTSSLIAMLGMGAAVGWLPAHVSVRIAGAAFLIGVSCFIFSNAPQWVFGNPMPVWRRAFSIAPAIMAASWYLLQLVLTRTGANTTESATLRRTFYATLLVISATLLIVWPNYLPARSGMQRAVICLDSTNGATLWIQPVLSAPCEAKHHVSSFATPTPCSDGRIVVADFGWGTVCLDVNGNVLWRHLDDGYGGMSVYGASSSPVLVDDAVILVEEAEKPEQVEGTTTARRPSRITAWHKNTGEQLWQIQVPEAHDSYATPTVRRMEGRVELITVTAGSVIAYDVNSGQRLWKHPLPIGQVGTSAISDGKLLWIAAGAQHHTQPSTMALRMPIDGSRAEVLWETKKSVPTCCSPVCYRGLLFTVTENGVLTCYSAETGRVRFKKRLPGKYYASLLAGHGKIYATNSEGRTTVFAAEPKYRELSTNELPGECYSSAAVMHNALLMRTTTGLYCIGHDDKTEREKDGFEDVVFSE